MRGGVIAHHGLRVLHPSQVAVYGPTAWLTLAVHRAPTTPKRHSPQTLELYTPMHTHTRRPLGPPLTKHSSTHIASARAEQELNSSFGAEHSTRLFCAQDNLTRVSWVIYQYISPRSSPRHAHLCATPLDCVLHHMRGRT